jgi:hypothetical protein
MSSTALIVVLVIMGVIALLCLLAAFRSLRRKRLIDDLPTSKTRGVFIGLAELKGTAESETPLTSYMAGTRCVQYAWQVDEQWSRIVTETYTDAKGISHTRTRTETGWTRVDGGHESPPFYLQDDTGVIRIIPEHANINGVTTFNQTVTPGNSLYFLKGPAVEIANSTHRRRFHETALPIHAMLYIVGQARERQDAVAVEIAYDKSAPIFLISNRTEKQISTKYNIGFWIWLAVGLIIAAGAALSWTLLNKTGAGVMWQPYAIAIVSYVLAVMIGWFWTVYNSLVNIHHRVEQGWSEVDVQLKRRHDLIPNLVQTVQGYRAYESETQQVITELRGQMDATPPGVTGPDFKGIAPMLRAISEQYPDLKASESFLKLQVSLADTEQRIALARDYYNDIATFYNTRLSIIPDRFVAGMARLRPRELMSAADFERAPVQVKLAD